MIEHMTCQKCGYPTTPGPDGNRWCSIYGTHERRVDPPAPQYRVGIVELMMKPYSIQRGARHMRRSRYREAVG